MSFDKWRPLADAILLEGYALYPYRASSAKNRYRWTIGVLAPKEWSEAGGCEPWWMETQCLARVEKEAKLDVRIRFLQIERRVTEECVADCDEFRAVQSLDVEGRLFVSWDEGVVREIDRQNIGIVAGGGSELLFPFDVPGASEVEEIRSVEGVLRGRMVRCRLPLLGRLRVRCDATAHAGLVRLSLRVENVTPWAELSAPREQVLGASCAATHLFMAVSRGSFVSLLDPPDGAQQAASECKNVGAFPVLLGPADDRDLVLSSPIILYDYPRLAPESPGDFFDATEIDELLALRTSTLTDEEKREARAVDPRTAAIIDRVEALPAETKVRLHGAIRDVEGAEMRPRAQPEESAAFSKRLGPGCRVRLCPGRRRTDAQDILFAGCIATVEKVMTDIDGHELLAVTVDEDPAADLHRWYGRFHYYYLDEVEPVADVEERA